MAASINPNTDITLHPLTLAFTKSQKPFEALYADDYFKKHINHLRYCHYLSILFYLLVAFIDYAVFPSLAFKFWGVRFGFVAPCFIVGLVISYGPFYRKIWRQLSFFYILITGISFIATMVMAPAPDSYTYAIGITICLIFGYTFIREPFLWASAAGCILLAVYFTAAVLIEMPGRPFLLYGFYLAVINTIGMFIAYTFEIQSRKDFFLNHLLNLGKMKVNKLANGLEKEVRSRTQDLLNTNEKLSREIRERTVIENALRVSEHNYRSLQSNIPIGLYRIVAGKVISANPAMVRIFRAKDEKALLSRRVVDSIYDPADIDGLVADLQDKGRIVNAQVRLKRADGKPFWGLVNVARGFSENRSAFCYDGTLEDITAREAMAKEKENLRQQLRQARKMESIGTLAGGIAHDFNNILAAAMGYTELALDDVEKETLIEEYLLEIKKAGNRATALVKQILTFARRTDEALAPVHVGKIAEEALRFLRSSIPTTIRINSRIASEAFVLGNATEFHQIFMNLCTNAAHAMEDAGGVIDVSIKDLPPYSETVQTETPAPHRERIEISVADTGRGIPPMPSDPYSSLISPLNPSVKAPVWVWPWSTALWNAVAVPSTSKAGSTREPYSP